MSSTSLPGPRAAATKALTVLGVLAAGFLVVPQLVLPSEAAPPEPSATQNREVIVANDSTRPVPTQAQGTTQVAGNVQVAGSVVAAPAGELVQFDKSIILRPDSPNIEVHDVFEVPDGKRLVVEHVTGSAILHHEGRMQVRVGTLAALHSLPFQPDPNTDADPRFDRATASEAMTFFVDDAGPDARELKIRIIREGLKSDNDVAQIFSFVGRLYNL